MICTIDGGISINSNDHVFDFKNANWNLFKSFINNQIDLNSFNSSNILSEYIDDAIGKIVDLIMQAKSHAIPMAVKNKKIYEISDTTKSIIAYRNKIRRNFFFFFFIVG